MNSNPNITTAITTTADRLAINGVYPANERVDLTTDFASFSEVIRLLRLFMNSADVEIPGIDFMEAMTCLTDSICCLASGFSSR